MPVWEIENKLLQAERLNTMSNFNILSLILSIPGLLLALTFHEFAHGYVAYLMGDNTARYSGRLSLNPMDHLDIWGTLCLLFFRFGWAKPVPINPANFRDQRKGIIAVSLAGPLANFLLALVSGIICTILRKFVGIRQIAEIFYMIFLYSQVMNVGLMVFNLIPNPPLDGSKVLMEFLPYRMRYQMYQIERYSGIILLVMVWTGILSPVLNTMAGWVYWIIGLITNLI